MAVRCMPTSRVAISRDGRTERSRGSPKGVDDTALLLGGRPLAAGEVIEQQGILHFEQSLERPLLRFAGNQKSMLKVILQQYIQLLHPTSTFPTEFRQFRHRSCPSLARLPA